MTIDQLITYEIIINVIQIILCIPNFFCKGFRFYNWIYAITCVCMIVINMYIKLIFPWRFSIDNQCIIILQIAMFCLTFMKQNIEKR